MNEVTLLKILVLMNEFYIRGFNVTRGDEKGEVNISWDSVNGAHLYIIQFAGTGNKNNEWKVADIINESFYTLKGLKNNRSYFFRVAAVNSRKQGPWSRKIKKDII